MGGLGGLRLRTRGVLGLDPAAYGVGDGRLRLGPVGGLGVGVPRGDAVLFMGRGGLLGEDASAFLGGDPGGVGFLCRSLGRSAGFGELAHGLLGGHAPSHLFLEVADRGQRRHRRVRLAACVRLCVGLFFRLRLWGVDEGRLGGGLLGHQLFARRLVDELCLDDV